MDLCRNFSLKVAAHSSNHLLQPWPELRADLAHVFLGQVSPFLPDLLPQLSSVAVRSCSDLLVNDTPDAVVKGRNIWGAWGPEGVGPERHQVLLHPLLCLLRLVSWWGVLLEDIGLSGYMLSTQGLTTSFMTFRETFWVILSPLSMKWGGIFCPLLPTTPRTVTPEGCFVFWMGGMSRVHPLMKRSFWRCGLGQPGTSDKSQRRFWWLTGSSSTSSRASFLSPPVFLAGICQKLARRLHPALHPQVLDAGLDSVPADIYLSSDLVECGPRVLGGGGLKWCKKLQHPLLVSWRTTWGFLECPLGLVAVCDIVNCLPGASHHLRDPGWVDSCTVQIDDPLPSCFHWFCFSSFWCLPYINKQLRLSAFQGC